jgi:hypothetical protein
VAAQSAANRNGSFLQLAVALQTKDAHAWKICPRFESRHPISAVPGMSEALHRGVFCDALWAANSGLRYDGFDIRAVSAIINALIKAGVSRFNAGQHQGPAPHLEQGTTPPAASPFSAQAIGFKMLSKENRASQRYTHLGASADSRELSQCARHSSTPSMREER